MVKQKAGEGPLHRCSIVHSSIVIHAMLIMREDALEGQAEAEALKWADVGD